MASYNFDDWSDLAKIRAFNESNFRVVSLTENEWLDEKGTSAYYYLDDMEEGSIERRIEYKMKEMGY